MTAAQFLLSLVAPFLLLPAQIGATAVVQVSPKIFHSTRIRENLTRMDGSAIASDA